MQRWSIVYFSRAMSAGGGSYHWFTLLSSENIFSDRQEVLRRSRFEK
jgi:hypothetical protein